MQVSKQLYDSSLNHRLMIDCSHGNSLKDHRNQRKVLETVAAHVESEDLGASICGVMVESNLVEGKQNISSDKSRMVYGMSVTDACIGWEETVELLERLAVAVRSRRSQSHPETLMRVEH